MKKNLAIIAMAMLGFQVEAAPVILTFANSDTKPSFATDNWNLNGSGKGAGGGVWDGSTTLSDNATISVQINDGKLWNYIQGPKPGTPSENVLPEWTNTAGLVEMNSTLGSSITATEMKNLTYIASGASGSRTTLTLNLVNSKTAYKVGDSVTFFIGAAASAQDLIAPLTKFSVSGLTGPSIEWAAPGGDGYETGDFSFSVGTLGYFKVTGTLSSNAVVFASDQAKNGFGFVGYTVVPEPASATLSLIALAGLCSRRRRKK